jgi:phosphatidylserine/phosphatidylglycerophosphate/cardiolipin synthase-like enzyme
MKILCSLSVALLLLGVGQAAGEGRGSPKDQKAPPIQTVSINSTVQVAFSPNGQATQLVVNAINAAQLQILVQAYGFTSFAIIRALVQAHNRGVDVRVLLDKSNQGSHAKGAAYLAQNHVPLWIDDTVRIAHNKVMVIDYKAVVTGSFNFTRAAQSGNAENVLYLQNAPDLAKLYINNWNWRWGLSHPYDPNYVHRKPSHRPAEQPPDSEFEHWGEGQWGN